ncbi:hypothetical protein HMPREF1980_01265 [Actinomyces sp. oral taxon 172 str. F0311]|nr:hypothetical protein HMPREF1980_01265 [Actinomyces sp. oral taxon 172 str. F0311]
MRKTPYNESINTRITRVSLQEVKRFRVIETFRVAPDPPVDPYSFVMTSQLPGTWKAWDLRYTHDYERLCNK